MSKSHLGTCKKIPQQKHLLVRKLIVNAKKNDIPVVKNAQNGTGGSTASPRGMKRKIQKHLTFYSTMTIYVLLRFLAVVG